MVGLPASPTGHGMNGPIVDSQGSACSLQWVVLCPLHHHQIASFSARHNPRYWTFAMEGLGAAANIIAVVDISAKVAALCLRYSKEVAGARTDIDRLHSHVKQLNTILQAAKRLADGPSADSLDMSRELIKSFHECAAELQKLEDKLAPSGTRQAMRRFGLRALKWPFTSKEVNQAVENLDRYRRVISLGLQIDQACVQPRDVLYATQ